MPLALVTGAGIRVGASIANTLAQEGFDLLLHANRSLDSLQHVASQCRAMGRRVLTVCADLSQPEGIQTVADAVVASGGTLDLLVNNAAIFEKVAFSEITREAYARMQAINLEAPFFLTQAVLPALRRSPQACIVNITDIAAERPFSQHAHYCISKAGLLNLTKALAIELAPEVRVNAVSPGAVAFPENYSPEEISRHLSRVPMKRAGRVEDVAEAVLFFARHAPYVTGQVLAVDGGRSVIL